MKFSSPTWVSALVTLFAGGLAVAHLLKPSLGIDGTTLGLLALAAVPWLLPLLKSLELPGGVKIELRDVQQATEKIGRRVITGTGGLKAGPASVAGKGKVTRARTIEYLRQTAERDPNLALVGFRIELEKRLRALAQDGDLPSKPLGQLARDLVSRELMSEDSATGMMQLISFGNQAAHGADVSREAVFWALDYGGWVLEQLDSLLRGE